MSAKERPSPGDKFGHSSGNARVQFGQPMPTYLSSSSIRFASNRRTPYLGYRTVVGKTNLIGKK